VSIYSNTETSLVMSTLVIWCRVVQSRVVRSRVFSRPGTTQAQVGSIKKLSTAKLIAKLLKVGYTDEQI